MTQVVLAIYEHGVLRPLEPLELHEHEQVRVTVESTPAPSREEVWQRDPLDGLRVSTGIRDLADHFDDYRFGGRQP